MWRALPAVLRRPWHERPEERSTGLTPRSATKDASLPKRSGLLFPTVLMASGGDRGRTGGGEILRLCRYVVDRGVCTGEPRPAKSRGHEGGVDAGGGVECLLGDRRRLARPGPRRTARRPTRFITFTRSKHGLRRTRVLEVKPRGCGPSSRHFRRWRSELPPRCSRS